MIIRQEKVNDYQTIYKLVKTAFETAKVKDGNEQDFVNVLRNSDKYIPELALVAEKDNQIIGHIMLTKTYVENGSCKFEALLLAPVSVMLEYRKQGIGTNLIRTSMEIARDMGFKAIFLAGDPMYYHRFGFVPTMQFNIKCSLEIPEDLYENIMACELVPQGLDGVSGVVKL